MSIVISSKLLAKLEARMDMLREEIEDASLVGARKQLEHLSKTIAEMRGTAVSAGTAPADDEKPAKKGRKTKLNADGTEKAKRASKPRDPNSPYSKLQAAVKVLYADVSAEDRKALTANGFGYLVLCGYLKKLDKETLTADDMAAAVAYLKENPDYKSKTQIQRSGEGSVASGEKGEKGEKEEEKEKEKKPRATPAKKSEKPAEVAKQVIAKLEAALSDSDDESDDEEEEESERVPLETFDYKGQNYLKDPYQELYTAEGEMLWVGTWNGKKIDLAKGREMPARVREFIRSQD